MGWIGVPELVLIFIILLLIFGGKKIPSSHAASAPAYATSGMPCTKGSRESRRTRNRRTAERRATPHLPLQAGKGAARRPAPGPAMSINPPTTMPSPQIREEIALQKATVARLKKEIVGVDRNARKRYIRDFHEEFSRLEGLSTFDDLVIACYQADLVFIGDYHALPASQEFAAHLLGEVAARSRQVVLCLEMVYTRNQKILDSYMAAEIGEAEF